MFTTRPSGKASGRAPGESAGGGFTLNFENAAVQEVAKVILGDLLKDNYVVDSRVHGTATLQTSRPVHREALLPTLEMVLRMNGAALVRDGNLYRIVPADSPVPAPLAPQLGNSSAPLPAGYSVRIVPLEHIAAGEMRKILEPFARTGNLVRVDSARNLLILAGTGRELARLLDTVHTFDVDWLAGMSVALLTPNYVTAKDLASDLEPLFGEKGENPLSSLVRIVPIEHLNALLVITPRAEYLRKVRAWVRRFDRPSGAGRQLFVYHVQNGKAVDIANVLNQVFGERAPPAVPPPRLAPGLTPARIGSAPISSPVSSPGSSPMSSPLPSMVKDSNLGRTPTLRQGTAPQSAATGSAGATASQQKTAASGTAVAQGELAPQAAAAPAQASRPAGMRRAPRESSGSGEGLGVPGGDGIRIIPDEVNNALVILATSQEYAEVRAALQKLDIVPLQVLIEATIAEITLSDDLQYGLEWFFTHGAGSHTGRVTLDLDKSAGLSAVVPGFSYAITDAAGAVRAVLNSLASDSRLNVVSSPSLVVLNNQTARIQVGDEVPITTQQQQATVAQSTLINSIEFRDTGVLLSVTPRVNAGGLVTMEIDQEVSDVAPGTANSLTPTIQQRKISSTVAVQSGQTVVLGGLIRENKSVESSGIPVLYKLPLIGPLFGKSTDSHKRTELVVLITPRAIENSDQAHQVTEEFRSKMESLRPLTETGSTLVPGPAPRPPPAPAAIPAAPGS